MAKTRKKTVEDYIRSPTSACKQWVDRRLKRLDDKSAREKEVQDELIREWFAREQGYYERRKARDAKRR